MRPVTDLAKLHSSFNHRLLRLRRLFGMANSTLEACRSELLAVSVIELDNLVLSALRVLTISSLQRARTALGHRVTTARRFGHEEEISAYMLNILEIKAFVRLGAPDRVPRRNEPVVRDPRSTEKVWASCAASNIGSLQNALALNTTLFTDLGTIRNFYAHRNADTCKRVKTKGQAMGIFGIDHPNDLVTACLAGRPVALFEDWLDDAELFFEEATK